MPICQQCGRCCCEKIVADSGDVFFTPWFCRHFDAETRRCSVYARRHSAAHDCMTVDEGIAAEVFPASCPYVAGRPGYTPPRFDWWADDTVSRIVQHGGFDAQFLPELFDELFPFER